MKKNILSYFFFILAFSCFIVLRVYAGKNFDGSVAETAVDPGESVLPISEAEVDVLLPEQEGMPKEPEEEEYLPGIINDEWHGDFTPVAEFSGQLPRIVCWGDSLTASFDMKTAYPDVLRQLSGCEVINYGVESENTKMIAMREGGIRVNVKATVIPDDCQLIPVFLRTEDEGHVFFLDHGDGGVNPCSICGIEGTLQKLNGAYYFERSSKGERISVPEGTQFKTYGMNDAKEGDVLVIFTGTNDMPDSDSVYDIIKMQRDMLEFAECDRYVVVGLTYGGIEEIEAVNEILANEYGDHFVDVRNYMLAFGLEDAGLSVTEGDKDDIGKGEIPRSLRRDYVHGNADYYKLTAQQIYRKMQYLGYLPKETQ